MDWCDAFAYCQGVGKRLCGKIGGGSADYSTGWDDATQDQWHNACDSGGADDYPYGSTYQPQTCNGHDHSSAAVPVGSMSGCQSSVPGYAGTRFSKTSELFFSLRMTNSADLSPSYSK